MLIASKFRYLTVQTRAILFLLASVAFFTGMAVCIRISATYLPILEVVFFRNLLAAIIMVPILWPKGLGVLKMNNPKLFYVRGVIGSIGMVTGFTALTLIPLAQTTSISFSAPIFVTIGAMLFLGEVIKIRRIMAVFVGFLGMLIILQPGFVPISLGIILAFIAALSHGINALVIKKLTLSEAPDSIVAWMVLMLIPITFFPAVMVWEWPSGTAWFYLWAMALFGTLAHMCITRAYSLTEITSLQPLEFMKLPLAALAAWILFSEVPDIWTWIGGTIIFSSTAYISHREVLLSRSQKPNQGFKETKF